MKINGRVSGVESATEVPIQRAPLRTKAGKHLSELQIAMQATGMLTRYEPLRIGPPRLVVTNPDVRQVQENIYAAPRNFDTPNEEWCFLVGLGRPDLPRGPSRRSSTTYRHHVPAVTVGRLSRRAGVVSRNWFAWPCYQRPQSNAPASALHQAINYRNA